MTFVLAAGVLLLGGILEQSREIEARWAIAGRWQFPVGDIRDPASPADSQEPGYSVTRNIGGPSRHQGADLSNRRAGGAVRAAAHGVVLVASPTDNGNGYGLHVVVAHRLPDGDVVFSVYAHLAPRSIAVRPGDRVTLGQTLGRVGATGDATSAHLHFEIRVPSNTGQRWELGEAVDPLAFVRARLPAAVPQTDWAHAYLAWAERAGVTQGLAEPTVPLRRGEWRRMLAAVVPTGAPTSDAPDPTAFLQARGILPPDCPLDPLEPVSWKEVAGDLIQARSAGVRLPPLAVDSTDHRNECRRRFALADPSASLAQLARHRRPPSTAEVCLVLADLTLE